MNAKSMILSFLPWIVFSAILRFDGSNVVGYAAFAAAALGAYFIYQRRATGVKLIDATGVATFAVMAVLGFAGSDALKDDIANYGRGISTLVLAAIMIGSIAIVPFTAQYARETVPQIYWSSPRFIAINRKISAVWGLVVLAMAASNLLQGHEAATGDGASASLSLLLNWVIPAAFLALAISLTKRLASDTDDPAAESHPAATAGA